MACVKSPPCLWILGLYRQIERKGLSLEHPQLFEGRFVHRRFGKFVRVYTWAESTLASYASQDGKTYGKSTLQTGLILEGYLPFGLWTKAEVPLPDKGEDHQ